MSEQTEQTSKTKKILLIGNGFDLRTGVKTTFRDFFRFVIYGVIWHNYSKSEVIKTVITKSEFSNFKPDSEISPEELFEKFFEEKIKNKVPQIAKTYRKKDDDSEHSLEILLNLPPEEQKIITEKCRKFIETELGDKFVKYILNNKELNNILRIDLTTENLPDGWMNYYNIYYPIYGLSNRETDKFTFSFILDDINLGEGIETIAQIFETNFKQNLSNITLWSDVETVIELLIAKPQELKTKYNVIDDDLLTWNYETLKNFSDGLDIFEFLLAKYLDAITKKFDIKKRFSSAYHFLKEIYSTHKNSMNMRNLMSSIQTPSMTPDYLLEFLNNPDLVINYNYTDIAKKIYEKLAKEKNKADNKTNIQYVHINGEINHRSGIEPSDEGFNTNIVIGYTNLNNSDVPKELYHFEKSCRRIVKNTEFFNLDYHMKGFDNFDLLIIGHSCCAADGDIIGDLLKHEKLKNALILCHTKDDLISINNNIRHILRTEPLKYGELMTHLEGKETHNLFYAVEPPGI